MSTWRAACHEAIFSTPSIQALPPPCTLFYPGRVLGMLAWRWPAYVSHLIGQPCSVSLLVQTAVAMTTAAVTSAGDLYAITEETASNCL